MPASVDKRVRKKWSRRAKLIGYGLLAGYCGFLVTTLLLFETGTWFVFAWSSGFAAAIRYLRAGRLLESNPEVAIVDEATEKLLVDYREKIRVEGQREVAAGTLSIPDAPGGTGELSFTPEAGALSSPSDD